MLNLFIHPIPGLSDPPNPFKLYMWGQPLIPVTRLDQLLIPARDYNWTETVRESDYSFWELCSLSICCRNQRVYADEETEGWRAFLFVACQINDAAKKKFMEII